MKMPKCDNDYKEIKGWLFIAKPIKDAVSVSGFKFVKEKRIRETARINGCSLDYARKLIEMFN